MGTGPWDGVFFILALAALAGPGYIHYRIRGEMPKSWTATPDKEWPPRDWSSPPISVNAGRWECDNDSREGREDGDNGD